MASTTINPFVPLLSEMGRLIVLSIQARMKDQGLKNTRLIQSVTYEVSPSGSAVDILANFYAEYVDRGRPPGLKRVPIDALIRWINDKKIKGRSPSTGRFITTTRLAWIIQSAIFKNGIKARPFLLGGLEDALAEIDRMFGQTLPLLVESELKSAFTIKSA